MSTRSWRRSHPAATRVGGISAAMKAPNGPRRGRSRTQTSAVSKQCGNCLKPALASVISVCVSGFCNQSDNGDNSSLECLNSLNSLFDPTRRAWIPSSTPHPTPPNPVINLKSQILPRRSSCRAAADGGSVLRSLLALPPMAAEGS